MGIYLNPGKVAFEQAVNSEIYVDKTDLILYLNTLVNTNRRFVSVSRPRRFGKTMTADMLCAYYDKKSDGRELFSGRKPMMAPMQFARYTGFTAEEVDLLCRAYGRDYNKTETYEALAEYIRRNYDGLKDAVALLMDGGRLRIDTSGYQNDMMTFSGKDDILSLLVHLGYLSFDEENSEVFIPNREILDEFRTSTKSDEWIPTFKAYDEKYAADRD